MVNASATDILLPIDEEKQLLLAFATYDGAGTPYEALLKENLSQVGRALPSDLAKDMLATIKLLRKSKIHITKPLLLPLLQAQQIKNIEYINDNFFLVFKLFLQHIHLLRYVGFQRKVFF